VPVSPKVGIALGKFVIPLGTSEVLPQVVDHPVSEELPQKRVAFVTESQFAQRISVRFTLVSVVMEPPLLHPALPRLKIAVFPQLPEAF